MANAAVLRWGAVIAVAILVATSYGCAEPDDNSAGTVGSLVNPRSNVGNTSAATLLWDMYPDTQELTLCREDVEVDVSGRYIAHGVSEVSEMPTNLLERMESAMTLGEEERYIWFGLRRITVLEQEWVVRSNGLEGPWASVAVFRLPRDSVSGPKTWVISDSAAVYLCSNSFGNDL
jgi:hypothetical protein